MFSDLPHGRPLDRGIEHIVELEKGTKPIMFTPNQHPKWLRDEIKKTIQEMLDVVHIRPSKSPFASSIILVKNKDDTLQMCIATRCLIRGLLITGIRSLGLMSSFMSCVE